ncbi:MAG TPA: hypothetical protein VGG11_02820 [Xanthobacteraceae bacterium]|jgi:hypothetical protein
MAYRTTIALAAIAALGVASFSTSAFAFRGGAGGFHGGVGGVHAGVGWRGAGVYRGGAGWHGGYARRGYGPGWGVAAGVGAAALGAAAIGAAASPYYNNYYNSAACGYYPYPACY